MYPCSPGRARAPLSIMDPGNSVLHSDAEAKHPDSDNISGCYDAISKFVEQFPEIPFYILALQDSANRESRVEGIGPHKNVNYITDENRRELISYLMGI